MKILKNSIFIHATNMNVDKHGNNNIGHCQNILNIIKQYISESNLDKNVDKIFLEIQGDKIPSIEFDFPNAIINYNGLHAHEWEFPTQHKIRKYALDNPEDNILYLHTQGVSYPSNQLIEERREYLLYWNVSQFKKCLELLNNNDTCGAMLIDDPVKHYSQNFWWAKCKHINTLQDPTTMKPIFDYRHNAEFWVCSSPNGKYSSIHNLYDHYINAIDFSKGRYR
jgi:hypothetical protein